MEVKKHRRYTKEFKEDVLNMLRTGEKSVPELSKDLGIHHNVIYEWYNKSKGKPEEISEKASDKDKEIRALRAKLADITEERDILKKAISIFSKQDH